MECCKNGNNFSPPSMWNNPSIMEFREMRSNAPTPSTDKIVVRGSRSVTGLHNVGHAFSPSASPDGVLERCNGFLCGFGDLLSHGPRDTTECVPHHNSTNASPSGFCDALILPNLRTSIAWGGTSPRATMLANSVEMFTRHPRRPRNCSTPSAHVLGEPLLVQLERNFWKSIQQLRRRDFPRA